MHILIAPNAFKHSLTADEAVEAIERGLHASGLSFSCEKFPVGDGGDGTADIIIKKFSGEIVSTRVSDPLGRPVDTYFGIINGDTAVIEMANASGIRLLEREELNPLLATSYGTGEQMRSALDCGVKKIIVGLGGSATVDGGKGILEALGLRFTAEGIDESGLDARIKAVEIVALCDVQNVLLGEEGAAAVFGPQKGATPSMVKTLEQELAQFATMVKKQKGVDINIEKCGAAGGTAAGLYGLLNAQLTDGIAYFLHLTNFEDAVKRANLVITGEGKIDEQTLQGKAPFGVARLAKLHSLPVLALAGNIPLQPSAALNTYFDKIININKEPTDLATAIRNAKTNLEQRAKEIGEQLNRDPSVFQ